MRMGKMTRAVFSVLFFFVLFVSGASGLTPAERDAAETGEVGYGLMMDAGSTGSRIHVYRWVWNGDSLPNVTDDFFKQVKPGLSAFASDPAAAAHSLQPLLDYALSVMPETSVKNTWVQLFATAGLRLLPDEQQTNLLNAVRQVLASSPFIFQDDWVAIASGEDEAVDAWITANYILKTATHIQPEKTFGTIDLGGGSLQITTRLEPSKTAVGPRFDLYLGDESLPLFAQSYLGYGLMEQRRRVDGIVIRDSKVANSENDEEISVEHPCLLKGAPSSGFFDVAEQYVFNGTSDFDACFRLMQTLASTCNDTTSDCTSLASMPPPNFHGRYLAFSYVYDVLPEFVDGDTPTVAQIATAAREICKMDYETFVSKHKDYETSHPDFQVRACQDLTYILYILEEYLNIPVDAQKIQLVKQIHGKEMSWTLGATLRMLHRPTNAKREL